MPAAQPLAVHDARGSATVNLLTGATSVVDTEKWKDRHAVSMGIAWGVLLPLGAIIARYLRGSKHWCAPAPAAR